LTQAGCAAGSPIFDWASIIVVFFGGTQFANELTRPHSITRTKKNENMTTLAAKGTWNIAKGRLKQTIARLTHDNLQFMEGKVDELVGRIQKRKAQTRNRIERGAGDANDGGGHQ
jgi:uncharacterized protein YjbJ (UPF0337 family)